MAESLSQVEVDELIKSLVTGQTISNEEEYEEEIPEKVKLYDFRSANKFPKEQMKTLRFIHENFARIFSSFLSSSIGGTCEITVVSAEEQKYQEFIRSLPHTVVLGVLDVYPIDGHILLQLSSNVLNAIICRVFGGIGDVNSSDRIITEIEMVIIERLVQQMMPLINESWEKIIKVNASLNRIETNPAFAHIVSPNETIAIITLNLKLDDSEGLINFCIPKVALEPISKMMNTRTLFTGSQKKEYQTNTEIMRMRIEDTPLTLHVVFSETTVLVNDIISLQVGDVIQLDATVHDQVNVYVENIPKFKAKIGVKNSKYAVKIMGIINEEDQINE